MGEVDSKKIQVTLPAGMRQLFNQLVARKLYGDGNSDVGRYLISTCLDQLVRDGRLIDAPLPASSLSTGEDAEE